MPLAPGTRLGPYEIQSLLGKGGMGEVYRARDPKLNRDVAIKILPPTLANDPDYLARFQREAQTLAALNHPNIAAIYGLEQNAIVMELVDGQTLQGPLPTNEVIQIGKQIAEALEAAHEKGIVHRDLKPGNVKITPEGVVKVLDFGLAKAAEKSISNTPDSPTLTLRATEAGLILGTAGYMSPEQAAGKTVDRRADIWAFGVVLHELLTGKRLFDGETVSHTLAEVLKEPIRLDAIPAGPLRDLIKRCLDRNIRTRLQHIGEARIALENYTPTQPAPAEAKRNLWPWALAAAMGILAAGLAATRTTREPATPIAFEVNPPPDHRFAPITTSGGSAISPDGKTLAFVGINEKREEQLYLRGIDSIESRLLPGTLGAGRPFWSPDSKSIAFVAYRKLKRMEVAGGPPITLCDAAHGRGGDWSPDGNIVFAQQATGIHRIPASGGTPVAITALDAKAGEVSHYYPQFLPDGKRVLYLSINQDPTQSAIVAARMDGKDPVRIIQSGFKAHYHAGAGRLFYLKGDGTLMARTMTLDPPALTGDPVVVAEEVRGSAPNGYAEYSLSTAGDLFYGRGEAGNLFQFTWRDRAGKLLDQPGPPGALFAPVLSPEGGRIAYTVAGGTTQRDVWVLDLVRKITSRITFGGVDGGRVIWSSDGKSLYFGTREGISRKAADGSGQQELVSKFTPKLNFQGQEALLLLQLLNRSSNGAESDFEPSPDRRWLAYSSTESGRSQVFVRGFPDERGKWQASTESGGVHPHWRADGKELYWSSPVSYGAQLFAAVIELQPTGVRIGKPEPLFETGFAFFAGNSPDGRRFLIMEPPSSAKELPMVLLRNLPARLAK